MNNRDDLSATVRIDIPQEILEEDLRLKQLGIKDSSSLAGKPGVRSKEIASLSIRNADIKSLFDNLYDAALMTNISGHIIDANPRAIQAFICSRQELTDSNIQDIIVGISQEVLKSICENLTKNQFTLIQAYCIRSDGTHFPAEISSSRIHLSSGDYLCFFIRDVTTRREAEDEIRNAKNELEQQVAEHAALNEGLNAEINERKRAEEQLYHAILQLQEHDKSRSEFVSNVSHELKTPVTSINYAVGNILKGIAGPITDGTREYLDMIRDDCQRLSRTVESILDMSRIEADTLKLKKVKINFARFARKTVESLRIQIEAAGLSLETNFPDMIGFAECDPEKFERVIFNVVKNAIKYNTQNGSIRIELKYDNAGCFLLNISDTGIGIEEKYLSKVTERFFRIGEHVSGVGLGLAIAKEIMERHGGSISFQSPPPFYDKGTMVSLRLPVTTPPIILVVYEDEQNRLKIIKKMDEFGYNVVSMKHGDDISHVLGKLTPDLATVEWISPGLEGAITISAIRNIKGLEHLPVIALTGDELDPVKKEILHGLALPLLKIPWQSEELLNCIEYAIISGK